MPGLSRVYVATSVPVMAAKATGPSAAASGFASSAWRPRHRRKRDVVVGQVDDEAVEPVRDRRAGRTPRRVVGPEHEVVDEELRAPSEEVCQQGAPLVGLESILLVDPNPRQLLPPPRQLVATPRDLLLRPEHLEPRGEPLFTCPGHVLRHRSSLLPSGIRGVSRSWPLTAAL